MKIKIVLYSGDEPGYQMQKAFGGESACQRSDRWARNFPAAVAVAGPEAEWPESLEFSEPLIIHRKLSIVQLVELLAQLCEDKGIDTLIFGLTACPFYNTTLTRAVLYHHLRYKCEYTFADGYAGGLAPVVADAGAVKIMAELVKGKTSSTAPVTGDALFSVIQDDINSFEVETVIAPEDIRMHRLDFTCTSRRGFLACERLFELTVKARKGDPGDWDAGELGRLAVEHEEVRRTVPSFYALQVCAWSPEEPIYSPYGDAYRTRYGHDPSQARERNRRWALPVADAARLAAGMAGLSGEAVVSFINWGEPLAHPDFPGLLAAVLAKPGLSVLVETNGGPVSESRAADWARAVQEAGARTNGHPAVYWVVSLDAATGETYRKIRPAPGGTDDFAPEGVTLEQAIRAVEILRGVFPPDTVYPQFVRMNENEGELETFYRTWKERGNLIIQKHDWFIVRIPESRPADLSPLERNPCWHLLRDMVILADGSVPVCRECVLDGAGGNAFTEDLGAIWRGLGKPVDLCKGCDEYYTFNF